MTWILTHSGKEFDLIDPQPDMIDIHDIAHGLAHVCRFAGHVRAFYSVAQHSALVACHVDRPLWRQALLHDATEAYIGDVSQPLKQLLPDYRQIERRIWHAIAEKFEVPEELDQRIKHADQVMLMTEADELMGPRLKPWCPSLETIERSTRVVVYPKPAAEARANYLHMWSSAQ